MSDLSENYDLTTALPWLFSKETVYAIKPDSAPLPVAFEGNNRKGIVLLYDNPASVTVLDPEKDILNRMLTKLNSSFEDVILVNISFANNVNYAQLHKQFGFKVLIAFGVSAPKLGLNIEAGLYQTIAFGNAKLLFSDSLLTIDKNNAIKKTFWKQFAPLFV